VSRTSVRGTFEILKSNNSKIHRVVFPEHISFYSSPSGSTNYPARANKRWILILK